MPALPNCVQGAIVKSEYDIAERFSAATSSDSQFSISTITCHDLLVLSVRGDLDLMTGDRLIQTIDQALASGAKNMVIDMTMTEFLGAAGLTALDHGRRRIESASLLSRESTTRSWAKPQ